MINMEDYKGVYKKCWFSDYCMMEGPAGNVKRAAKLKNKVDGTKSKFSGPFTEKELERFNSINGTGKW